MRHDRMKIKVKSLIFLVFFILLASSACNKNSDQVEDLEAADPALIVGGGNLILEGTLVPNKTSTLSFLVGGKINAILVQEGQAVEQGDALMKLSGSEPLEAAFSQAILEQLSAQKDFDALIRNSDLIHAQHVYDQVSAQNALLEAQESLNNLDNDFFFDQLDYYDDILEDATEDLETERENLDQYSDLDPDNYLRVNAQDAYDDAFNTYETALNNRDSWQNLLDKAQAGVVLSQEQYNAALFLVDTTQAGPNPEEKAVAESRLDHANAQVSAAQAALDQLTLLAPYPGIIISINEINIGESVLPGAPVINLADFSAWRVKTKDLSELDIGYVSEGQKVTVIPDAFPDLALPGIVDSIDLSPTERSGSVYYTVNILLDRTDPSLRWGLSVSVIFE